MDEGAPSDPPVVGSDGRIFSHRARGHDHYWCCKGCYDTDCEFGPCCAPTVRLVPARAQHPGNGDTIVASVVSSEGVVTGITDSHGGRWRQFRRDEHEHGGLGVHPKTRIRRVVHDWWRRALRRGVPSSGFHVAGPRLQWGAERGLTGGAR